MLKRILTAIVGLAILVPVLYFSHTYIFVAAVAFLSFTAVFEILTCVGQIKNYAVSIPALVFAAGVPLISRSFATSFEFLTVAFAIMFVYMFYLFSLSVFTKGKFTIKDAGSTLALIVYVIYAFVSLILLRDLKNFGKYIYLLAFLGPWISDTFAYFGGYFFGKHKLIPEVSPKKTVEGMISGIIFCTAAFVVFGIVISKIFGTKPEYLIMLIAGIIISLVSQLGDLIASIIKRQYNIKDYGKILPGHGGIMDRFDSIIAVTPFLYIIFAIISNFTTLFV